MPETKGGQAAQQGAQPSEQLDDPIAPPSEAQGEPEKDWLKLLYTEERVTKWARGEMTLAELDGISGPEMLEMAVTGYAMYEQGRYREAKIIFDGLTALDPKESYYRTALGAVYLAQDMLDESIREFDLSLQLNEKDIAAFVNRGEARLRKGMIVEAAQDFAKAVELDPEGKDPMSMRARALAAAALETLEANGISENALQAQAEAEASGKPYTPPAPAQAGAAPAKAAPAAPAGAAKPAPAAKQHAPHAPKKPAAKPAAKPAPKKK